MVASNRDEKLKPLQPTLREKKRFVKFEIVSDKKFSFKEVSIYLMQECIEFIGAMDLGKSGFWLLRDKFDESTQQGILKVSTKYKDKTLGSLGLITSLQNTPVRIKVLRVSGTLKGLEKVTP